MNRREALKKLGAGTAIAAGVSTVRVVPAFAYDAPTLAPEMSFTFAGNVSDGVLNSGFNVSWKTGRATCPASATSTTAVTDTAGYSPTNRAHVGITEATATGYEYNGSPTDGTTFPFILNTGTGHTLYVYQPSGAPVDGDMIEFYGVVGFRCDYVGDSAYLPDVLHEKYCCVTYVAATDSWSFSTGPCV